MFVAHDLPFRSDPHGVLSPREQEVLALVATGLTAREIGERLFISKRTVETHCSNVKQKLGLRRRAEFIVYAVRRSLAKEVDGSTDIPANQSQLQGGSPRTTD